MAIRRLRLGCHVGSYFIGCILYADDIILLSASVSGLKRMLECCYDVSCELSLNFNSSKSYCFSVGKGVKFAITDLYLGPNPIQWSSCVKYEYELPHRVSEKTPTHIIGYKLRSSCLILIIFDNKIPHIM